MKRRAFLSLLGLAPVAAVAARRPPLGAEALSRRPGTHFIAAFPSPTDPPVMVLREEIVGLIGRDGRLTVIRC